MYIFKKGQEIYTNQEITVVKEIENDLEFAIDDSSYQLFTALYNGSNAKIDGGVLKIGRSKINLLESQFTAPNSELANSIVIDTRHLRQAIKFVGKGDTQPVLTGVYVNKYGTVAATDRYKMYALWNGYDESGIVLPVSFIKEILKYVGDSVELRFNAVRVECVLRGITIYSRLYNGRYPNLAKLAEMKGNEAKFDPTPYYATGELVGGDINVWIKDGVITFEGDNEYVADIESDIDFTTTLDNLKCCTSVADIEKVYYNGSNMPLVFETKQCAKISLNGVGR